VLIDKGGAEISRQRRIGGTDPWPDTSAKKPGPPPGFAIGLPKDEKPIEETEEAEIPGATVVLRVRETHDGQECDCIDTSTMTLQVGDSVTLHHTCHDGRKDEVQATILEINVPFGVEHATASVTKGGVVWSLNS
jgi:hypothetical protein